MAITFQNDKHGPVHSEPDAPANAPLVLKIGDKADDARFRALGLDLTSEDPEKNITNLEQEGRIVAFDKKGEFITFHYSLNDNYGGLIHNSPPGAPSRPAYSKGKQAAFIAIFTRPQLAEFLTLTGGTLTGADGRGTPNSRFDFTDRVPLAVLPIHNPYTKKTENTLYLYEQIKQSTAAKVIDNHHLGGFRVVLPETAQLEIDACAVSMLQKIAKIIINQSTITEPDRLKIIEGLIQDVLILNQVMPEAAIEAHAIIQKHQDAGTSRKGILHDVYRETPFGIHHDKQAAALDTPPAE